MEKKFNPNIRLMARSFDEDLFKDYVQAYVSRMEGVSDDTSYIEALWNLIKESEKDNFVASINRVLEMYYSESEIDYLLEGTVGEAREYVAKVEVLIEEIRLYRESRKK